MYAKCGALSQAEKAFENLPFQDVISWNALVSGYAQHGYGDKVIHFVRQMQQEAFLPDNVTFACILKACAGLKAVQKGKEIHTGVLANKFSENNVVLQNALIDMYAKCGALERARRVFNEICIKDVVSWNALIAGHCQGEDYEKVFQCIERMTGEGFCPDVVTLSCALKACGSVGGQKKGEEIHAEISTVGFLNENVVLGNALIDMYAKCGALKNSEKVLQKLPGRDVVSWNTLIAGYSLHGHPEEALHCLERMKQEGLSPNDMTYGPLVKACSSLGLCLKGIEIHAELARKPWLLTSSITGNALVDMYAKCNLLAKAQEVFSELLFHDVVSWTSLIAGYSQHGDGEEALKCLEDMRCEGISPDHVTFVSSLKAFGLTGAIENGSNLHCEIVRMGLLGKEVTLGGALVEMYADCGVLKMAKDVFDELPVRNRVSYSALIAAVCEHGYGEEALHYFEKMLGEGLVPDVVTFGCILKACRSMGAARQGQTYFDIMTSDYGIVPNLEHHIHMIDIFGCGGEVEEAMAMIRGLPSCDHVPAWFALMGACKKWGNLDFGRQAFDNAIRLNDFMK